MMRASHGWNHVDQARKREIIDAIKNRSATSGPSHLELDLTDRCNVACYFCNQQDLRTKDQICLERIRETIDELAKTGLKSVRLSGGGDPLFHRQIHDVLDHIIASNIIIDNLTTNGVAMTPEISRKLVDSGAREVIVSLNAPNPEQYHRMLRVKPQLFEKVVENVRSLVAVRGDAAGPSIVIQFLLDRSTLELLPRSYDLAAGILGPQDRIGVGLVLPVRGVQLDQSILLDEQDVDRAEPYLREVLSKDRDRQLLQIDFPYRSWSILDHRLQAELEAPRTSLYPTASSFREENGGCFFPWYTAAVTGNGDVRPCCLMLNPEVAPIGNINDTPMEELWHGERFETFREEMREVLVNDSDVPYDPARFQVAEQPCTESGFCWLKNMFFRGDEEFYAELATTLDHVRRQEQTVEQTTLSRWKKRIESKVAHRALMERAWRWAADSTRPLRRRLRKRFGIHLTEESWDQFSEAKSRGYYMVRCLIVEPDRRKLKEGGRRAGTNSTAFIEGIPEKILTMSGHHDFEPTPGQSIELGTPGRVRLIKQERGDIQLMVHSKEWGLLASPVDFSGEWRVYWNSTVLPAVQLNGAKLGTFVPPGKSGIRLRLVDQA